MYKLIEKMEQILRKPLKAVDRPYSQLELAEIRQRYLDRLNVGNTMVYHEKTGYFYLAKAGGRKEAQVQNGEEIDPATCSVTWKLRKTPNHLRDEVRDMIDAYHTLFENKPERWTPNLLHLENTFYKWLYIDFDRKKRSRN